MAKKNFFYCWSGLDLSLDERLERLKDLFAIICFNKVHVVGQYGNRAETKIVHLFHENYEVSFKIKARTDELGKLNMCFFCPSECLKIKG